MNRPNLPAFAAVALLATVGWLPAAGAASCMPPAQPQPADDPRQPAIAVWPQAQLAREGWTPPACSGWPAGAGSLLVVAVAARDAFDGDESALLARIGAISRLKSIRYWSTTDGRWGPLANDAVALAGPQPGERRGDFAAAELQPGAPLHYRIEDPRAGELVYRLRLIERSATRIALVRENASAIRAFGFTVFPPASLQSFELYERATGGRWTYRSLTRIADSASARAAREDSLVNRAIASYRNIAGLPTDMEPPARR